MADSTTNGIFLRQLNVGHAAPIQRIRGATVACRYRGPQPSAPGLMMIDVKAMVQIVVSTAKIANCRWEVKARGTATRVAKRIGQYTNNPLVGEPKIPTTLMKYCNQVSITHAPR